MGLLDALARMEAAAGKATPGARTVSQIHDGYGDSITVELREREYGSGIIASMFTSRGIQSIQDAEFIAECSPDRIKALCAVARSAQELLTALETANDCLIDRRAGDLEDAFKRLEGVMR
jgi:hypothetical protein